MAAPKMIRRVALLLPAAALCAALLSGCSMIGMIAPAPTTVNGNSQLTTDGVEAIKITQAATFDFTTRPLMMSALGFPEDSDGTMISADPGKPITVSMKTPSGVVDMVTDTIRVRRGADGTVSHFDIYVQHPDTEGMVKELQRAGGALGFSLLNRFESEEVTLGAAAGKQKWYPGYGNKSGTVFSVEIYTQEDTGSATFIYSAQLADKFYAPEAAAQIAATGKPRW